MSQQIPQILQNFNVYKDGYKLLGVADVELPSIEALTETIKGAGIAGEIETPILGHFGSMTCKINFHTSNRQQLELAAQTVHHLDFRAGLQAQDVKDGGLKTMPLKVVCRVLPKKTELGKMEPAAKMDSNNEFEVIYIKVTSNSEVMIEIDKLNYICVINGKDYLQDLRVALGEI